MTNLFAFERQEGWIFSQEYVSSHGMKLIKMFVGISLLFPSVVLTQVLWDLLLAARTNVDIFLPLPAVALVTGSMAWILLFTIFPRPLRSYILAHELTHALWGVMMGARISRIRVKADHGSVVLSKTNFLITLAPYFFPLYTVLAILVYLICSLFYDLQSYSLLWLGLVGFTWAFHVTFTINALLQRQTDIQQQGKIFSYVFIYFANVLGVCIWVVLVTTPDGRDVLHFLTMRTARVWDGVLWIVACSRAMWSWTWMRYG